MNFFVISASNQIKNIVILLNKSCFLVLNNTIK